MSLLCLLVAICNVQVCESSHLCSYQNMRAALPSRTYALRHSKTDFSTRNSNTHEDCQYCMSDTTIKLAIEIAQLYVTSVHV